MPQLWPWLTQGFGGASCCSSGAMNRRHPAAMQGGPQVPLLEAGAMCNLDLGCVSQTIGGTRTRLPAPSRPAWTQQMLRLLTEMPASMLSLWSALPSTLLPLHTPACNTWPTQGATLLCGTCHACNVLALHCRLYLQPCLMCGQADALYHALCGMPGGD